MNTAAMTSGWPTREIALLIAEPRPARSTGTEAMRTVVSGATTIEMPAPKITPARKGPRIVETGGTSVEGSVIEACHGVAFRSEEHTSELQSHSDLVCRLLLEK